MTQERKDGAWLWMAFLLWMLMTFTLINGLFIYGIAVFFAGAACYIIAEYRRQDILQS